MFKLFHLPIVLIKMALCVVAVAYVVMMFPTWTEDLNVSKVVQAGLGGMAWLMERIEKLP